MPLLWRQPRLPAHGTASTTSLDSPRASSSSAGVPWVQWRRRRSARLVVMLLLLVGGPLLMLVRQWPSPPPLPPVCPNAPPPFRPPLVPLQLPPYKGPPVSRPDRYTLILNSYKRPALLQQAVARYSQCADIDAIRVVWCEGGLPPSRASAPSFYSDAKEVRYDIMPSSSLNSRFWPVEGLRTEAVLNIDDDLVAPCGILTRLFRAWQSHKRTLVGFYPRLHVVGQDCRYQYLLGWETLVQHGRYSMVLTKGAMMHRDYLEAYTHHMPAAIRTHVDQVRNCEDIAMQLLVTNATGLAPLFVHSARVVDLGKGLTKVQGISSSGNFSRHIKLRTECLNVFARYYGGSLPLVSRAVGEHADAPAWWLRASPYIDHFYRVIFYGHL